MLAHDLALLVDAALEAGEIARRHFGNGPESWDKGDSQGPVSIADIEVNDMLRARLCTARPAYGWLSEETPDSAARLAPARTFIIDPIDGTRAFLAGEHSFVHSLALAEHGAIIAAVVHAPMRAETYTASLGGGAFLNGAPLRVSTAPHLAKARILTSRASLNAEHWAAGPPAFACHFRPSLAWRMCLVAAGQFDAMITLRPTWEWDVAAGALMVSEAGGRVITRSLAPPRFNNPDPRLNGLLAGPLPLIKTLGAALNHAGQ
ncbi:MAG: 3'(2'),5'-bisphosphate nucleotidase CysQ [Paracoccaceae bacterium]